MPPPERSILGHFQPFKQIKNRSGFTLAEVLITLGIIGVVAALTLPNLVAKYQEMVAVVRLKKAYSTLANAINKAMADEGYSNYAEMFNSNTEAEVADKIFAQLNIVERCAYNTNGCGGKYRIKYKNKKNDGKGGIAAGTMSSERAILPDGTIIGIVSEKRGSGSDCRWEYQTHKTDSDGNWISDGKGGWEMKDNVSYLCAEIFIDTDGPKGKNQFGYDNFSIEVKPAALEQKTYYANLFDTMRTGKLNYENYSLDGKFED